RLPKSLHLWIVKAERARLLPGERNLLQALDALKVIAKDVFVPAEDFHAARLCLRQDSSKNIKVSVIWSLDFLERCMAVVLFMSSGEVAAMKVGVILLLAMIRQRLTGNLAAGNATSVSEGGEEERVDAGVMLKAVKHRSDTFINERNRAHLNADHACGSGLC